jgi:hypothetical protein
VHIEYCFLEEDSRNLQMRRFLWRTFRLGQFRGMTEDERDKIRVLGGGGVKFFLLARYAVLTHYTNC